MSDMWMPAQTTVPPLPRARRAAGTSSPAGAKMIAASSSSGGVPAPAHSTPSERANALRLFVSFPRHGKQSASLPAGDLRDNVRRGAETVEAKPLGVAGHSQRPVADQAGAEQRRDLEIGVAVGKREAEALVGDGELRVAAVDVVAGEARSIAQVLAAAPAVAAHAAGPAEPGHADPAAVFRQADDLVTGDERQLRVTELAVDDVEVRSTNTARPNLENQLARAGNGTVDLGEHERRSRGLEHHRSH